MAFPTIESTTESADDANTNTLDLTVTITSAKYVLVMASRPAGNTITSVTWDQGGANTDVPALGAQQNGTTWGGIRLFGLAFPSAGTKTMRMVASGGADQIAMCVVAIMEEVEVGNYTSAAFNDTTATFTDSLAVTCQSGDAVFFGNSDDHGTQFITSLLATSGCTFLARQNTGSADSCSAQGWGLSSGTSKTVGFDYECNPGGGGSSAMAAVRLREVIAADTYLMAARRHTFVNTVNY